MTAAENPGKVALVFSPVPSRARHLLFQGALGLGSLFACGSPLETDTPNTEGCAAIGRALLSVCGGEEASVGVPLFQYLNCNILPGCPGGQVEGADVKSCVSQIEAQRGTEGGGKPRILECRDALAVECEVARTGCGDAEETPPGGLVGFWTACFRVRDALGYDCLVSESTRDAVTVQAAGDAEREATLTEEATLDACMGLLGCGRTGAFSDSDLSLMVSGLSAADCEASTAVVRSAEIDRAFCGPIVDATVVVEGGS